MPGFDLSPLVYETSAFLFVGGKTALNPAEITARLGIVPEKTSDTPSRLRRPPGWKTWFYSTETLRAPAPRTIDATVTGLLSGITAHRERFAALPPDCERKLAVTVWHDPETQRPITELAPETISLLSSFSLSLCVEYYDSS